MGIILFLLPITPEMVVLWWGRGAIMALAVVLTAVTGADYVLRAYRTRRDSKASKAQPAARGGGAGGAQPPDGS